MTIGLSSASCLEIIRGPNRSIAVLFLLMCGGAFFLLGLSGCVPMSYGLVVESVDTYVNTPNFSSLGNSVPNGDGFIDKMKSSAAPWTVRRRWTEGNVYDIDFIEGRQDANQFDLGGVAISYFTGHGTCSGSTNQTGCTSTSQCNRPPSGTRLPGSCKVGPGDVARCIYTTDRSLVTESPNNQFGGFVNYSNGTVKWGESPQSGGWAQAGTDGGTNMVVLDSSCGVLGTFWVQQTIQAFAGMHMLAATLPVTGDTGNVSTRGSDFAAASANLQSSVAQAWLLTVNSVPGSGFNGGGCTFAIAYNVDQASAIRSITEDWRDVADDSRDVTGIGWYAARWLCNWPVDPNGQFVFELP